jgi:hypothetical protein
VNIIGSQTYKLAKHVTNIFSPFVGHTNSLIKNSNEFINIIKNEKVRLQDTVISFYVVSLLTKIPLDEAIQIFKEVTDCDTTNLSEVCLCSTFFSYQGEFYEQTNDVEMGSPLSPIIANLFMENFENKSLDSFPLKPLRWKIYVDDTNVLWPHGKVELQDNFQHLNNISDDIKFTMELEENNSICFIDVLIKRKSNGHL